MIKYLQENLGGQKSIKDLRDAAVELFYLLKYKPPIQSSNPVIGTNDENGEIRPDCQTVTDYYLDMKRIEFLLFWASEASPVLSLLQGNGKLPLSRNDNFERFIKKKLDLYINELSTLSANRFLSADDVNVISDICNDLVTAVESNLDGLTEAAFNNLKRCMERIKGLNLKSLGEGLKIPYPYLYKMRLGNSNATYSSDAMFHIPFE